MKKLELYISSVLAGMLIGIAGTLYIASGKSFFGAVLFTVALFTICTRGMGLFTGRVGYLWAQSNKLSYIAELGTICEQYKTFPDIRADFPACGTMRHAYVYCSRSFPHMAGRFR